MLTIEEIAARLDKVEIDLAKATAIQTENVPLFRQTLKRIATMRTTIHAHSNALARLETGGLVINKRLDTQDMSLARIEETTGSIAGWLGGAKGVYGFARKWGPRFVTFGVGVAITKGWISAENGQNFLHIFGF